MAMESRGVDKHLLIPCTCSNPEMGSCLSPGGWRTAFDMRRPGLLPESFEYEALASDTEHRQAPPRLHNPNPALSGSLGVAFALAPGGPINRSKYLTSNRMGASSSLIERPGIRVGGGEEPSEAIHPPAVGCTTPQPLPRLDLRFHDVATGAWRCRLGDSWR